MDLLIRDCIIVAAHHGVRGDVLIDHGRIAGIGHFPHVKADRIYEARGKILLPGFIDPICSMSWTAGSDGETWESASKAAVSMGITTVLDMPSVSPPTIVAEDVERKRRFASPSYVNYGFHIAGVASNIPLLHKMRHTASAVVHMEDIDDLQLHDALHSSSSLTLFPGDKDLREALCSRMTQDQLSLGDQHALHFPVACEDMALAKAIGLGGRARRAAFITTASQAQLVYGTDLAGITDPHHLFLSSTDVIDEVGKLIPPLRSAADAEALWQALKDGGVKMIASGHFPIPYVQKQKQSTESYPRVSSFESFTPMLLDAVNRKRITLTHLIKLCSENAAAQYQLLGKGCIAVGYDADLVLVDMDEVHAITSLRFHSQARYSLFEGRMCKGWPVATFVHGELVYERHGLEEKFYNLVGREVHYGTRGDAQGHHRAEADADMPRS